MLTLTMLSIQLALHPVKPGVYEFNGVENFGFHMGATTRVGVSGGGSFTTLWDEIRFDIGRGYVLFNGGPTLIRGTEGDLHFNAGLAIYGGVNVSDRFSVGLGAEGPSFALTRDFLTTPSWTELGPEVTWNTGRFVNVSARAGYCADWGAPGNVCGSLGLTYKWVGGDPTHTYINL